LERLYKKHFIITYTDTYCFITLNCDIIRLLSFFPSRSLYSQFEIIPLDKWEILPGQIKYEEELGRGAFGVVYKATYIKRIGMEVFDTKISERTLLSTKTAPQVVAVKVLHGEK